MEDPKTDRVLGVPERCMLCFSVDRTLSTLDGGVSHALGLTVALSPERQLRACWECGATLARLHRFEQRAVQALLLPKPAHATAKFKCLSRLSHSSTIVVDNDNKSQGQTRTEEDQRSVSSSPAVNDFMGCEINDEIKIEINEDFEKLPQCAAWINSVDLKVDCEKHEMNKNFTQSINKVERDKKKSVTPVKEAKEIKEEDNIEIRLQCSDDPPELPHLNKGNKLEKNNGNNAQVLKCLSRLSRSSTLVTDFNKQYFGETLPLASPSAVDNLIGCEISDETNININENLPQCSPWFNYVELNNEIETEIETHKVLKEHFPVDAAEGVQKSSLKKNFVNGYVDLTNPIISEDHEKASDIKMNCEKYVDTKKSFMQRNKQRLRETCVTTVKEVIKATNEDMNPTRLTGSANHNPSDLLSLIDEGKIEEFVCNDEQMLQAREHLKKMFPSMTRCRACLERFPGKETLRVHILERHTEVSTMYPFACDICTLRLPSPESLAEHRAAHYRLYRCLNTAHGGCNFVTASAELALTHARAPPPRKVLRCPHCSRPYLTKSSLAKHERTHNPDTKRPKRPAVRAVYRCPRCEHRCPRRRDMLAHMAEHARHDPAAYCAPCGRQFKSRPIYRAHLRGSLKHVRKEDLEHGCDQCKQRFFTRTAAQRHTDTVHRNLNIHKCRHCDSRFRGHGTLKRHVMKVHLGVDPVKEKVCDVCDRAFLTNNHLSRHKLIHTGERPYKCDICGAAFAQPATLQTHRRGMHLGMKRTREGWVRRDAPHADTSVASDAVAKTPDPDTTRRTRSSGRTRGTSVAPNSDRPPCYKDTTTSDESERDE